MFLGRWWEPLFVAFLVIVGYVFWALGVAGGLLVRRGSDCCSSHATPDG